MVEYLDNVLHGALLGGQSAISTVKLGVLAYGFVLLGAVARKIECKEACSLGGDVEPWGGRCGYLLAYLHTGHDDSILGVGNYNGGVECVEVFEELGMLRGAHSLRIKTFCEAKLL